MKTTMILAVAALFVGTAGSAAAQGLTESQARAAISNRCGSVSDLSRDAAGAWHGVCDAGPMMVDTSGAVAADRGGASFGGMSEGQARSALNNACSNVSELSQDGQGNWHGSCSNGAMIVDKQGKVAADKGGVAAGLTEDNVRSIANDSCSNVSDLSSDATGRWSGVCSRGAFNVDPSGKINFN